MRKLVIFGLSLVIAMCACEKEKNLSKEKIEVSEITLNKETVSIAVGQTVQLVATVLPEDANNKELSWKSSDEGIVTVKDGLVTAVKEGEANISATSNSNNNISKTCAFTVSKGDPFPVSPAVFTNNSDKEVTIAFMGVEDTYCEIDGELLIIKKGEWTPDAVSYPSNADLDTYVKETTLIHKKMKDGLAVSQFKLKVGQSIKIYDQTKICYVYMLNVASTCDFSKMPELMYINGNTVDIKTMDFSNSPKLDVVLIQYSPNLTKIDISNCAKLQYWTVANTGVQEADFSNTPLLKHCAWVGTYKKVDLSNCTKVAMNIFGGDTKEHCVLEEVVLNPNMNELYGYWVSLNESASDYPANFIFKFHINNDPNSNNLPENHSQVLKCLADYTPFGGRFCMEFKEGDKLWRYNKTTNVWEQEVGSIIVESLDIVEGDIELTAGESMPLHVSFTPEDASDKRLTWVCNDNDVAMVINGVVYTYKPGTVTLSAISTNEKFSSISLKVNKASDLVPSFLVGEWEAIEIEFWSPSKTYDEETIKNDIFVDLSTEEKANKVNKIKESKIFTLTSDNKLTMKVLKIDGSYMTFNGKIESRDENGNMKATFDTERGKGIEFYGIDDIEFDLGEIDINYKDNRISVQHIYGEYDCDYDLITYYKIKE